MIIRAFSILWLGLLLTGCKKPASPSDREAAAAAPAASERRGLSPRGQVPDPPQQPRAIMEAAAKMESPAAREKALADVVWNAIETDPGLAHEAFLRLTTDSPEKIRLIQHYAMSLAEEDVEAALDWADALGSEHEIAAANARIAIALAETDPLRAANLLSEAGVAGREFDVAVVQVLQRWAEKCAPDAAAWVTAFPPGAAREAGIGVIAGKWLARDPSAAFAWLGGVQDAEVRKEAARAMEGIILQQSRDIREAWLEHADADIKAELERQRSQALRDMGDNILPTHD